MGYAQKVLPHYTYSDYVQWEGRWELLEGFAISMRPGPWPEHQRMAVVLGAELELACRKTKVPKAKLYPSIAYKIAEDTLVCPDILIVCAPIENAYLDFPPVLVAEIISPSSALLDRHTKFEIYEQQGVKYYLIVDVYEQKFELYKLKGCKYVSVQHDFRLPYIFRLQDDCKIEVVLDEIWANI